MNMVPHGIALVLFLTIQSVVFTEGQDYDYYPSDNYDALRQGYFDRYQCTLQCYADVYSLLFITGDLCKATVKAYSNDWGPVPFERVVASIECITKKCRPTIPPPVCGGSYYFSEQNDGSWRPGDQSGAQSSSGSSSGNQNSNSQKQPSDGGTVYNYDNGSGGAASSDSSAQSYGGNGPNVGNQKGSGSTTKRSSGGNSRDNGNTKSQAVALAGSSSGDQSQSQTGSKSSRKSSQNDSDKNPGELIDATNSSIVEKWKSRLEKPTPKVQRPKTTKSTTTDTHSAYDSSSQSTSTTGSTTPDYNYDYDYSPDDTCDDYSSSSSSSSSTDYSSSTIYSSSSTDYSSSTTYSSSPTDYYESLSTSNTNSAPTPTPIPIPIYSLINTTSEATGKNKSKSKPNKNSGSSTQAPPSSKGAQITGNNGESIGNAKNVYNNNPYYSYDDYYDDGKQYPNSQGIYQYPSQINNRPQVNSQQPSQISNTPQAGYLPTNYQYLPQKNYQNPLQNTYQNSFPNNNQNFPQTNNPNNSPYIRNGYLPTNYNNRVGQPYNSYGFGAQAVSNAFTGPQRIQQYPLPGLSPGRQNVPPYNQRPYQLPPLAYSKPQTNIPSYPGAGTVPAVAGSSGQSGIEQYRPNTANANAYSEASSSGNGAYSSANSQSVASASQNQRPYQLPPLAYSKPQTNIPSYRGAGNVPAVAGSSRQSGIEQYRPNTANANAYSEASSSGNGAYSSANSQSVASTSQNQQDASKFVELIFGNETLLFDGKNLKLFKGQKVMQL